MVLDCIDSLPLPSFLLCYLLLCFFFFAIQNYFCNYYVEGTKHKDRDSINLYKKLCYHITMYILLYTIFIYACSSMLMMCFFQKQIIINK